MTTMAMIIMTIAMVRASAVRGDPRSCLPVFAVAANG